MMSLLRRPREAALLLPRRHQQRNNRTRAPFYAAMKVYKCFLSGTCAAARCSPERQGGSCLLCFDQCCQLCPPRRSPLARCCAGEEFISDAKDFIPVLVDGKPSGLIKIPIEKQVRRAAARRRAAAPSRAAKLRRRIACGTTASVAPLALLPLSRARRRLAAARSTLAATRRRAPPRRTATPRRRSGTTSGRSRPSRRRPSSRPSRSSRTPFSCRSCSGTRSWQLPRVRARAARAFRRLPLRAGAPPPPLLPRRPRPRRPVQGQGRD